MNEDFEGALRDKALIGAAQRVEHYEIAAYRTARAFAEELGESEHVSLLEETLTEEEGTDEKLTELSKDVNKQTNSGESEEENEATPPTRSPKTA